VRVFVCVFLCVFECVRVAAAALAMALGASNDGCPAAETVIVANAGPRWGPLTVYYLDPNSNSTLTQALKDADIADVDQIMSQVRGCIPRRLQTMKA
jgi:hypothetical protein